MSNKPLYKFGTDPEKDRLSFRRLLIAKQLFQHGYEHSTTEGALNKMIAVHNFHNSIELVLKAILLHYEIQQNKIFNTTFVKMLDEIDKHKYFIDRNIRIPLRQQLYDLNQMRNLIQHSGNEPERSSMEQWRVLTHSFLKQSVRIYFDSDFEDISSIDLINDGSIKELLTKSLDCLKDGNLLYSLIFSKTAYEFAQANLLNFLPSVWFSPLSLDLKDRRSKSNVGRVVSELQDASMASLLFSLSLWAGIHPNDIKKVSRILGMVNVRFFDSGSHDIIISEMPEDENSVRWVYNFIVDHIVHLQTLGVEISTTKQDHTATNRIVEGMKDNKFSKNYKGAQDK